MAFQRTEYALGPLTESDEMNLKSVRCTRVMRELAIDHVMISELGVYPAFTSDESNKELNCTTLVHVET